MSDERTFWPSSAKREELRANGEMPYSFLVTQCIATIAVAVASYLIFQEISRALETYRDAVRDFSSFDSITVSERLKTIPEKIIFLPTLAIAFAVFLFGLVQTRFWIGSSRIGFDLSRVSPAARSISFGLFLRNFIIRSIFLILLSGALVACTVWIARVFFPLLNADTTTILPWLSKLLHALAIYGAGAMAALVLWGLIWSRLLFAFKHRMTSDELRQESSEFGS